MTNTGDTVILYSGTYSETVVIDTDYIALIGADSATTILDINDSSGAGNKRGIYAQNRIRINFKEFTDTELLSGGSMDKCR